MTEYTLGQRVRFTEHIQRKYMSESERGHNGPNKQWTGQAYPGKRFEGGEGVIVGVRTLSDGHYDYGWGEDAGIYSPTRHFTAYLVAYDLRRKPVHVLPEHITALDTDPIKAAVWEESAEAHRDVAANDYGPWPTNPYVEES